MTIDIENFSCPSDTHKTYRISFFDDTIHALVTNDPSAASKWLYDIQSSHHHRLRRLIVGLDVEWRPNRLPHHRNPVATLQLCVGRRCLVYQLLHSPSVPQSLVGFLSDHDYIFVGVNIAGDLEKLQRDHGFGGGAKAVDLRVLAAREYERWELRGAGLRKLARVVMEKEVDKPQEVTMSRWDNRWLTAEQVQYAVVDAFMCFEIGRILNASD